MMVAPACVGPYQQSTAINPMPAIWTGINARIAQLEETRAPKLEWDKSASESCQIRSLHHLREVMPSSFGKPDDGEPPSLFKDSTMVVHYGFDCDFHAVVFFDAKMKPSKVIKW